MKHLRTLALVLAMALCLTACGNGAASSGAANSAASSAEDTNANLPAEALTDVVSYLTDGAYTADSVIATVGDVDVTAAEALYWAAYQRYSMTYYYYTNYGYSINMTDDMGDGTTVGEYLLNAGISTALAYATGAQKANETGVTLSDENAAAVEGLGTTNIETYGQDRWDAYVDAGLINADDFTDEQKADWMQAHGEVFYKHSLMYYSCTTEVYKNVVTNYYLYAALQDSLFGEGGELAPTDATLNDYVQSYIADNGVLWGRCILFSTQDCADDDAKAEVKELAQQTYEMLSGLSGDELENAFTEQQSQYDKSGYTAGEVQSYSSSDSLVDGFYSGLQALQPGQVGITDETTYGYFVLLREADQPDSLLSDAQSNYISSTYDAKITEWMGEYGVSADNTTLKDLDVTAFYDKLSGLQTLLQEADTVSAPDDGTSSADAYTSAAASGSASGSN